MSFFFKWLPNPFVNLLSEKIGFLGTLTHMTKGLDFDEIPSQKSFESLVKEECRKLDNVQNLDEVVVGSGPCGGLVQYGNEQNGLTSLILEKGFPWNSEVPSHTPSDMLAHFSEAGLQAIIGLPTVPFAQGEVVGGGGVVNSGLYHRIPETHMREFQRLTGTSRGEIERSEDLVEKVLKIETQDSKSIGIYARSPVKKIAKSLNWDGDQIARWRTYSGPNSFKHHTTLDLVREENIVSGHEVTKILRKKKTGRVYAVRVEGESCKHLVSVNSLALCGGPVGTPRLLNKSGLARSRSFFFSFHHMQRAISLWQEPVNDLHDIDPYQTWSSDGLFKIGAAVSTQKMLKIPPKIQTESKDFSYWASHYISTPSSGMGGMVRILGSLWPFFFADRSMRRLSREAKAILSRELRAAGAIEVDELPPSTVHIFGSIPMGRSRLIDNHGFLRGTGRSIRIRDSSLIPLPLNVNPQGPALTLVAALEGRKSEINSC